MPSRLGGQDKLSQTLRELRRAAGLTGAEAAHHVGLAQPSISRYERGVSVPSLEHLGKLLDLYTAPDDTRRQLEQIVRDLREDTQPGARIILARGVARMQQRIGRIEGASRLLRYFQPALVPGLLQTPDYARAVFSAGGDVPDVEESVAARMDRHAVLDDGSKRFVFVLAEGVLRWQLGNPHLMAAQLEHIVEVSRRRNVRVGVIPWTTPATTGVTAGFDLYDQRAAIVGTETATAFLTDPLDVTAYDKLFAELEAVASFGDRGREWLAEAAEDYRALGR